MSGKRYVLVEVLKNVQDESQVRLNNSKLCDTQHYVNIDDVIEDKPFEEVIIKIQ